eukprot:TRINITY_DN50484_c0_g1_i1.p1 TRINITY_DN50484_c0_g1~~TRINITY_DN50484_c0_g1_i1.p1  ORF type:complete len:189 (+),score=16.77 TRINITY_DN50484_c0_g1_i1:217-783(+)
MAYKPGRGLIQGRRHIGLQDLVCAPMNRVWGDTLSRVEDQDACPMWKEKQDARLVEIYSSPPKWATQPELWEARSPHRWRTLPTSYVTNSASSAKKEEQTVSAPDTPNKSSRGCVNIFVPGSPVGDRARGSDASSSRASPCSRTRGSKSKTCSCCGRMSSLSTAARAELSLARSASEPNPKSLLARGV